MKLYDFQKRGIRFHLENPYSLNGCEMGLGKSLQSLEAARRAKASNLAIFCPAFLRANWENEIKKFYGDTPPFNYKIFPYSTVTKVRIGTMKIFDTWICDEAHYLKNYKAARTDHFHTLLAATLPERLYLLTGTPIKNRVPEFWTLLTFLSFDPSKGNGYFRKRYPSEWKFANEFCNKETLHFGGRKITKFEGVRKDKIPVLKALLAENMFRIRQKDALELPSLLRKEVMLGLPEDKSLKDEFESFLKEKPVPDSSNKAKSAMLKAPRTIDYVKDILDQGLGPVLVFTDHIKAATAIAEGLNVQAITGKMSIENRERLISDFTGGKSPVLVATIGTGAVGYNLTVSRHCVFNDRSWVPADNLQAEKRIHRIGQDKKVVIHLLSSGPIDSFIQRKIQEKMDIIQNVGV